MLELFLLQMLSPRFFFFFFFTRFHLGIHHPTLKQLFFLLSPLSLHAKFWERASREKIKQSLCYFTVLAWGCRAMAGWGPPGSGAHPSTLLSAGGAADQGVLHLHDEGRPHLGGRGHLGQRGLPRPCHPPGHQVISLTRGNRDGLPGDLCCWEIPTEEEGGQMVVSRSLLSTTELKTRHLKYISQKRTWKETGRGICGWCVGLCGSKPNSSRSLLPPAFPRVYMYKKVIAKKKKTSIRPLQYF